MVSNISDSRGGALTKWGQRSEGPTVQEEILGLFGLEVVRKRSHFAIAADGFLGLALLSAIVVWLFVKPLAHDGMIEEDRKVRRFFVGRGIYINLCGLKP